MTKKILIVVTSAAKMDNGQSTGIWLEEFGEAYNEFNEKGYNITVASPLGGKAPIDERSLVDTSQGILGTVKHLENTTRLSNINHFSQFDVIFLPGGHGTMFDLPNNENLHVLIRDSYENGKIIAAVCHGPAGLVGVTLSNGKPLVAGKTVTAFTDQEEREANLDQFMPFLLETRLRELGANFISEGNWENHVEVFGNLITGQNPQSTIGVIKEVIKQLQ